ncbi:hypothetical protein Hypma_002382 [Hypsizygus marmoreus]|uniref:Uncharacterized protein n=1 Tax=Hypsizygus marmoreus TaxID=39966 RepID=A0A369J454_HYPMA|nr:hypothetical protein Hypma_002382 [Hypsizygus marmoreus]
MPRKPSEILHSLGSLHDAETFHNVLRRHLYPFLDKLPNKQAASLVKALEAADNDLAGIRLIDFDKRSNIITDGIKALKKHIKSDWKYGYETQGEMMSEMVIKMGKWIPDLWTAGVEQGIEHDLVHKSLKFCKASLDALGSTNSRTEFGDFDEPEIVIEDASGKVVYENRHGTTEHAILWAWRDLLLSAAVQMKGMTLVEKLVAEIRALGLANEMLKRLDEKITGCFGLDSPRTSEYPSSKSEEYKKIDWHEEERRDLVMNGHLSPEMRATIPKVKDLFVAGEVAKFEKEPTENIYSSIMAANPNLRKHLLTIAKARFLTPKERWMSINPGFGIFKAACADTELLQLLELASTPDRYSSTDDSFRRDTIAYLIGRSATVRSKTRPHLERGLLKTAERIIEEIERVFPSLVDAWRQLARGKIKPTLPDEPSPKRLKPNAPYEYRSSGINPRDPNPSRDPILKAFLDKAGWTPADEEESEEEEKDDCYDDYEDSEDRFSDRYESRAEREDVPLNFITELQKWVKVLDQWPDVDEREAIKRGIRSAFKDRRYFFDVDGVADKLARRCDYGASQPCRQRLGRAIRELYYSFAKEGGEKDRMKKDMPSSMSFLLV